MRINIEELKKSYESRDEELYDLYLTRLLTILEIRKAYRDSLMWMVATLQSKFQATLKRIVENFQNILAQKENISQAMRSLILANALKKSLEEDIARIRAEINELVSFPEFSQTVASIEEVLKMIKKVE
jgi:hypothetical protein